MYRQSKHLSLWLGQISGANTRTVTCRDLSVYLVKLVSDILVSVLKLIPSKASKLEPTCI